jgi:hypothetical protein
MYQIIESGLTASNNWQVRVAISQDEAIFLKFPSEPTQTQVDVEAEAYVLNKRLAELRNAHVQETPPEAPSGLLTQLEYMERFTLAELRAIYTLAKTNIDVEIWLEKFKAVKDGVNKFDLRVRVGLEALESAGLIAPGRTAEILA